ncbi:hypothetical protein AL755_03860 (plasmid) [Arthrobacter sp. ERGS1:01]|nr:hypothetical protein AL755_03860 [Arthrobacter sp. ERGS1:01]
MFFIFTPSLTIKVRIERLDKLILTMDLFKFGSNTRLPKAKQVLLPNLTEFIQGKVPRLGDPVES